jgi:hypothetical protein
LAEVRITAALAVSAAKPCGVWISLTRVLGQGARRDQRDFPSPR